MGRVVGLEEQLISSGIEARTAIAPRKVRIIVRALVHFIDSALRNEQLFVLPDVVFARRRDQLDALDAWDKMRAPGRALWELDGQLVEREIELDGLESRSWLITLADVVPLIDGAVRQADPLVTEDEIDHVIFAASELLSSLPPDQLDVQLLPVDSESIIEAWIVDNLSTVAEALEMPSLVLHRGDDGRNGRQYRFADGRRADVVCRTTQPHFGLRRDGWLVIELKAGRLLTFDADQVNDYVELAQAELARDDEWVMGVLIGDGYEQALVHYINNANLPIFLHTLVGVGYHAHRYEDLLRIERDA